MPAPSTKNKILQLSSAISSPQRYDILVKLHEKATLSVTEIVKISKLSQSLVSYHLKKLKTSGLVSFRQRGKEAHYMLTQRGEYALEHIMISVNITEQKASK